MKLKDVTINMMVKNEERYIYQTLRSVMPYVDRAIIVDTGSEDKTVEIIHRVMQANKDNFTIDFREEKVSGDSINWDGDHLSAELTSIRNQMLAETQTKYVWQVDGDEICDPKCIVEIENALKLIQNTQYKGIFLPIKWCVSDSEYIVPGPFHKTLRIFESGGYWKGEFPNEFLWIGGRPITITDTRCVTLTHGFLHMSMALHPERRPQHGNILQLSKEEQERLKI